MHDYPETATILTATERRLVLQRVDEEQSSLSKEFRFSHVIEAMVDWKIWIHMVITLGVTIPMESISLFLPAIIDDLGYSGTQAKLMAIPPHLAACLFIIGGGIVADKHIQRGFYIVCFCFIG